MRHDNSSVDLLVRDLRALAASQPGDEHFRLELRDRLTQPRVRRRKVSLRLAFPTLAVAVGAAIAIIALVGSGRGGPTAAEAAVLHRTLAAMTPPAAMILHVKTLDTENGVQYVGEWWQQTDAPYASRGIKGTPGHLGEFADDGTTSSTYDPVTNTIYQRPDSAPPTFDDPVSTIRNGLANGDARVTGTVTIDGQSLYEIALSGGVTAYVDKSTYVPRYLDEPQHSGSSVRFSVITYQYLSATPENDQLLRIQTAHPDAHVDTNPQDWPSGQGK